MRGVREDLQGRAGGLGVGGAGESCVGDGEVAGRVARKDVGTGEGGGGEEWDEKMHDRSDRWNFGLMNGFLYHSRRYRPIETKNKNGMQRASSV